MSKRKIRINAMDFVILAVIAVWKRKAIIGLWKTIKNKHE